ncbi:hypothetical protein QR680_003448 [Steinernema hermaphroditum]|uniref:Uncharacterized protein n=1 Tax=Steinernema hermaphroditum TaxID=289476 RepID=A0AA39LK53_9BILA|nr:hypothetical protein QR680_003448 [Steinernema hermaphroditum]
MAYEVVRQKAPNLPQMQMFLDYFQRTFVRRSARQDALFQPSEWSCYLSVTTDQGRTNNGQEGWHNAFRSNFGSAAHPALSKLICGLKKEEQWSYDRLRDQEIDLTRPVLGFPRKVAYVKNDIAIKTLVESYYEKPEDDRTDEDLLDLLRALQYRVKAFAD